MQRPVALALLVVVMVAAAWPQGAGAQAEDGVELFPSTLEPEGVEEPEPEVSEEPEPESLPILERIGPNHRHPSQSEPLPPDVAFQVPGDARVRTDMGLEMPRQEPAPGTVFELSAGAGWTRQLANPGPIDYVRFEQRFEVRLPELAGFMFGFGVAELFQPASIDRYIIEVGPRAGMSVPFCADTVVRCEGVIHVQPGVAFGFIGTEFDLQAGLDARFVFDRIFLLSAGGALSFIAGANFVTLAGNAGLVF